MPVSTSNSKPRARCLSDAAFLATGTAVFLVCMVLGAAGWSRVPENVRRIGVPASVVTPPAGSDHYLAYYRGASVQHYLHYFGTSETATRNLRAADVLFVGNSRLLHGFPHETLQPFFAGRKLNYYVLGFLYGDTSAFPLSIIQRQDLHPKWVIANADSFFRLQPSDYAADTARQSAMNARQLQFETDLTFTLTRQLHRWLPHLKALRKTSDEEISFRSLSDGTMEPLATYWNPAPVVEPPILATPVSRDELAAARQFQAEVERRGGKLILTCVPRPDSQRNESMALAKALGVPLIAPTLDGLETVDRSHLDKPSALRYSQAFLEAFGKHLDAR